MARGIQTDIPDFGTSFNGYEGGPVERFIRENLRTSFRDVLFEPNNNNRMCFFASEADKNEYLQTNNQSLILKAFNIAVAGKTYLVKLTNIKDSTNIAVTTNETTAIIGATYKCQEKDFSATEWTDVQVAASVRVFVDAGATGTFDEITSASTRVLFGETFQFDVRNYLVAGRNQVRLQFVAENDEATVGTLVYTISLSEMYIDALNLDWYTAFVEGSTYRLGGFKIVGSISKTLKIRITDTNGEEYFTGEKYIGTSSYTSSPLYFLQSDSQDNMFPGSSGVYKVEAWLEAGTLRSNVLTYSIMCVKKSEENNCKLIVVNEVAETAYNYDTNTLFKYAVYNNGLSQGSPHILLVGRNEASSAVTLYDEDFEGISCGIPVEYRKNIEWNLSGVSGSLALYFTASYGGHNEVNSIVLDNTGAYEAELASIQFYLNAANRSNAQSNRGVIINDADHSEIQAVWTKMAWIDGIDGWTKDDAGRSCLRIPAGSKVSIPFAVFGNGDNTAFDVAFKCVNVADYDENIITLASNPESEGFHGVRIKPTNVTVHNNNNNSSDVDILQGTNFSDEEVIHLFISVARNYSGNSGKNLVSGYINGVINFHFEYTTGTDWANNVPIIIGSETADVFIYSMHSYSTGHGAQAAEKNFVNSLESRLERIDMNNKMELLLDGSRNIDFDKVKNNKYNFFTVEMLNGDTIPSQAHGWSKDQVGHCNFEMHFGEHPEWDFAILDSSVSGQGTTSMDYDDWNLRWRIDKDNGKDASGKDIKTRDIAYFNAPSVDNAGNRIFSMQAPTNTKTVRFDGNNHPPVKRITAKINWASSMQSHKIGATGAFNALHNEVFDGALLNEAQTAAQEAGTPLPVVAVYQYPAYGFAKKLRPGTSDIYDYEFIGLFTIGPDKGDKPSFGFDTMEPELMALEGTDHTPVMATFHQKWDTAWGVQYSGSSEALGVTDAEGNFEKAWEVSAAREYDTKSDVTPIMTMLTSEWKPAYDCAYNNNTQIFEIPLNHPVYGASTAAGVLANINADVTNFRKTRYDNRHTYGDMQFWIAGEYILYDYYPAQNKYVAGVNLKTECGVSSSSDWRQTFIDFRKQRFRTQAPNYWHIQESLFNLVFCEVTGASDNFAKNSYPYKMKSLANGGRWRWRNDDLDTLGPIDNQGKQTKPYFILYDDTTGTTAYFNGSTSYFWNTLREAYDTEYRAMGKEVLESMMRLGTGGGASGSFNLILNFVKKYFWDKAQNYFLKSAYNVDDVNKYIEAWLSGKTYTVEPLTQALGDNYRAEFQWFVRRIIFMMARFKVGAFSQYTDTSLGSLAFRASVGDMTMKPAVALYPSIIFGANSSFRFAEDRVMPGDSVSFNLTSSEDTMAYIPAVDWYTSLGDWKDFTVLGTNAKTVGVTGKRLREFKIGDTNASSVTTNIQSISFSNTPSLETLQCSNIVGLQGDVDLTSCTRLREAYFGGTALSSVILPDGSKIESLVLPNTVNALLFKNLKFIENITIPSNLAGISRLQVENCNERLDGFALLKSVYDDAADAGLSSQSNYRLYIRVSWDYIKEADQLESAKLADMLGTIADSPEKYFGIAPSGELTDGRPIIEGNIKFNGAIYMNSISKVTNPGDLTYTDPETGLVTVTSSKFGSLLITYDPSNVGIQFQDPKVFAILMSKNIDKDGDGLIKLTEAASVTAIQASDTTTANDWFKGTDIEYFNEFQYFTGITKLGNHNNTGARYGAFINCESLKEISLPTSLTALSRNSLSNCYSLYKVSGLENVDTFYGYALSKTAIEEVNIPNASTIAEAVFNECPNLKRVINLGHPTILGHDSHTWDNTYRDQGVFDSCPSLEEVALPSSLITIGTGTFYNCSSLTVVTGGENVENIRKNAFVRTAISNTSIFTKVKVVGEAAFVGCPNLQEVSLPSLTTLEKRAFASSSVVKVVDLGRITQIGSNDGWNATYHYYGVFDGCDSLTEVILPSTLTTIGSGTFYNCKSITKMVNINRVSKIYTAGLQGCLGIKDVGVSGDEVVFPNLTEIGNYGLCDFGVEKVLIFPSLTSLGKCGLKRVRATGIKAYRLTNLQTIDGNSGENGVIGMCPNLKFIELPEVTVAEYCALNGCNALESISMDKLERAVAGNFINKPSIREISLPSLTTLTNYSTNYNMFSGSSYERIYLPSLVNPVSQTSGPQYGTLFGNCPDLTVVEVPKVKVFPPWAFYNCRKIRRFVGYDSIEQLGPDTFTYNVFDDVEVSLPNLTTHIQYGTGNNVFGGSNYFGIRVPKITALKGQGGNSANYGGFFKDCKNLRYVVLGQVTEISSIAFYGCSALKYIIIDRDTANDSGAVVPTLNTNASIPGGLTSILVPYDYVDAYKAASVWTSHATKIRGIKDVAALPATAVDYAPKYNGHIYDWNGSGYEIIDKTFKRHDLLISNNSAYIQTDITFDYNTVKIKLKNSGNNSGDVYLSVVGVSSSVNLVGKGAGNTFIVGNGDSTTSVNISDGNSGVWTFSETSVLFENGDTEISRPISRAYVNGTLRLNANFGGVEYIEVYDPSGNLLNRLLPYDIDGVVCLVDVKTGKEYKPNTTGLKVSDSSRYIPQNCITFYDQLVGDGTAYIELPGIDTSNTYEITSYPWNNGYFFGINKTIDGKTYGIRRDNGQCLTQNGSGYTLIGASLTNVKRTISVNWSTGSASLGSSNSAVSTSIYNSLESMRLFGASGTTSSINAGTVYSFKVYNASNDLIMDLRPASYADIPGMYDVVNHMWYEAKGNVNGFTLVNDNA